MDIKTCACVSVSEREREIFWKWGINRTGLAGCCKHWIIIYGGCCDAEVVREMEVEVLVGLKY